jgi:hypothetical protein
MIEVTLIREERTHFSIAVDKGDKHQSLVWSVDSVQWNVEEVEWVRKAYS